MRLLLLLLVVTLSSSAEDDPAPISYPGQVNIGLLADMREGGRLHKTAAHRAMAAVWAAAQENFAHPQQLNIGVYIFDTCGRTDVAERQAYRLLSHVMPDKRTASSPPLFAVVTDGEAADSAAAPGRLLDAFAVPVVTATASPSTSHHHLLSTATDTATLATAAVSVLQRLHLLEVAVMAEEEGGALFGDFSRQAARVSGMQVEGGGGHGGGTEVEDSFTVLKHISERGKSHLKAVVFLVSSREAERLLTETDDSSHLPWLIVTPSDIHPPPQKRLRKVLLLSPESSDAPEFDAYFGQLLEEDTAKYHPLLLEHLTESLNTTTEGGGTDEGAADVSAVVRAVRLLSAALRKVQGRWCPRAPADCLRFRTELSGRVGAALRQADGQEERPRYVLKELEDGGDVHEVGFYSEEGGLQLYEDLLLHFLPPKTSSAESRWRIFDDDILHSSASTTSTTTESASPEDLLHDEFRLQSLSEGNSSTSAAANLRSVSLTSHQENHETVSGEGGETVPPAVRRQPVSAWLGHRPWALVVLGASALLSLAALYALVFLLVKGCEGGGALPLLLPALQLSSLLCLCLGAGLHAWKPSPLLCALKGVATDCALAFCYGGMLLRGMQLRAQNSLGLGGRVSRSNQLLTLALAVGVQVALETQRWPVECSAPKRDVLQSQLYGGLLLVTAAAVAASTRRGGIVVPFGRRESRSLLGSALCCALLFCAWAVARWLLPDAGPPRDIASAALLLSTTLVVLLGLICGGALGGAPRHKRPLSYADSLSTVFTLFSKDEGGSTGKGSTTGRGRTKTLEKTTPSFGENLLYSDYQSAYP